MRFENQNILILGASGGIGSQLTQMLLNEGASVCLHSHQKMSEEDYEDNPRVTLMTGDITQPEGIQSIVDAVKQHKNKLSGVIFAAGINDFRWLEEQADQTITKMMHLNTLAPMLITKHLLKVLNTQDPTFFAYIGSTMGSIGLPGSSVYCASKFALRGFVQSLRRELSDTNISCLYIAPRATKTTMNNLTMTQLNQTLGYKMDSPDYVAEKILKAILKKQEETYIGWPEKLFVKLNGLFPQLLDVFLLKQLSVFKKFAKQ